MRAIPRRVIGDNSFPAIISPGPRGTRTLSVTVSLTGGVSTSVMVTDSPSTSHMNVTYGGSGKR